MKKPSPKTSAKRSLSLTARRRLKIGSNPDFFRSRATKPKSAEEVVVGRRAVAELLRSGLRVSQLMVADGAGGADIDRISAEAQAAGIDIIRSSRSEMEHLAEGVPHQGIAALYQPIVLPNIAEFIARLPQKSGGMLILMDGIEDPRNLGAVVRSAEVFGADGAVIRSVRAARLTPAAVKASAGAALRLPMAQTINMDRAVRLLKSADWWIYGLTADGNKSLWDADFNRRVALLVGGEGPGLGPLLKGRSDELLRIPQRGAVASLNVAVAAGIAMAECQRQQTAVTNG